MVKTQQRGFTLIELVVVIVILGILAAFAVPRFMGLETEARIAATRSLGGTLRSTAAMAHGSCMALNCPNAAFNANISGQAIVFTQQYPNAATIELLLEPGNGFTTATVGGGRRFTKVGARVPANCWVQYNAAAAGAAPTIRFPPAAAPQIVGAVGVTDGSIDAVLRTNC